MAYATVNVRLTCAGCPGNRYRVPTVQANANGAIAYSTCLIRADSG